MRYVLFFKDQIFQETDNRALAIAQRQTGQVLGDRQENKVWDLRLEGFVEFPGIEIPPPATETYLVQSLNDPNLYLSGVYFPLGEEMPLWSVKEDAKLIGDREWAHREARKFNGCVCSVKLQSCSLSL
ncbi:hypothetical protein [Halomicronema sp. CCY15110]|uniref:hypothetical protein n=1 Tax=Halomicronema sp. CCY15110 TaxID=2767773 RepID=UPI00194F3A9F|nr:hypothetical protein [Halomicronema sp. CCY15110]